MSNAEDKNLKAPEVSDNVARCRLNYNLAFRGYIVQESDHLGPIRILVNGPDLQTWERVDKVKGDFIMKLVDSISWIHGPARGGSGRKSG